MSLDAFFPPHCFVSCASSSYISALHQLLPCFWLKTSDQAFHATSLLFLSSFLANFETSVYFVTFELLGFCTSVDELSVLLPYDTISPGIWFLMSYYHTVFLKHWHKTTSDAALYPRRMGTYFCNLCQNVEMFHHAVSTFVFLLQEVCPLNKVVLHC